MRRTSHAPSGTHGSLARLDGRSGPSVRERVVSVELCRRSATTTEGGVRAAPRAALSVPCHDDAASTSYGLAHEESALIAQSESESTVVMKAQSATATAAVSIRAGTRSALQMRSGTCRAVTLPRGAFTVRRHPAARRGSDPRSARAEGPPHSHESWRRLLALPGLGCCRCSRIVALPRRESRQRPTGGQEGRPSNRNPARCILVKSQGVW